MARIVTKEHDADVVVIGRSREIGVTISWYS
jgi:hypothetical protein